MSGFLLHLASMALGAKPEGGARLSLPPRFAGSPALRPPLMEDAAFTVAPEPARPERFAVANSLAPDSARSANTPVVERQPMAIGPIDAPPLQRPRRAAVEREHANRTEAQVPVQPLQAAIPPNNAPTRGAVTPAQAISKALAKLQDRSPALPRKITSDNAAARAPNQALPLSKAALAGRTAAARQQAPVIHVTIDRIDVRAPATSQAPPAPRRARSEPVVSLSDYLRGGGGGRG